MATKKAKKGTITTDLTKGCLSDFELKKGDIVDILKVTFWNGEHHSKIKDANGNIFEIPSVFIEDNI